MDFNFGANVAGFCRDDHMILAICKKMIVSQCFLSIKMYKSCFYKKQTIKTFVCFSKRTIKCEKYAALRSYLVMITCSLIYVAPGF